MRSGTCQGSQGDVAPRQCGSAAPENSSRFLPHAQKTKAGPAPFFPRPQIHVGQVKIHAFPIGLSQMRLHTSVFFFRTICAESTHL